MNIVSLIAFTQAAVGIDVDPATGRRILEPSIILGANPTYFEESLAVMRAPPNSASAATTFSVHVMRLIEAAGPNDTSLLLGALADELAFENAMTPPRPLGAFNNSVPRGFDDLAIFVASRVDQAKLPQTIKTFEELSSSPMGAGSKANFLSWLPLTGLTYDPELILACIRAWRSFFVKHGLSYSGTELTHLQIMMNRFQRGITQLGLSAASLASEGAQLDEAGLQRSRQALMDAIRDIRRSRNFSHASKRIPDTASANGKHVARGDPVITAIRDFARARHHLGCAMPTYPVRKKRLTAAMH